MIQEMVSNSTSIDRPRIGLALSGGAARGIAHVGVLRALEENNIPIDAIAGASAGALIGGAYAAGLSIPQLEELAKRFRWRHMGRPSFSRLGLQSNKRMETFLRAILPVTRFEDLKIPFAALAMDLHRGSAVVLRDEGDVPFAIRASTCIPAFYVPVRDPDGRWLVDGGLVASLPISHVRAFDVDYVIASDVNFDGARFFGGPKTAMGVLAHVFVAVEKVVANQDRADADVLIAPKVGHIRWDQTRRADELVKLGYEAALGSMDRIKSLIQHEPMASAV